MTERSLIRIDVRYEHDIVAVRQRAREIAASVGLSTQEQTAFATSASEIARNAFLYAGGGRAEFLFRLDGGPQSLLVRTTDSGKGIEQIDQVLGGRYVSATGMGLGIIGSQRLCDVFEIDTAPGRGTTVLLGMNLPKRGRPLSLDAIGALTADLARRRPMSPLEEVQQQNRELLHTMEMLRARQAEVERLNAELAETNRGVVALYAELDDRAESLRRASEYKSRFLSDMTHELRTPLNAVISLSRLLLDRADGELTPEQDTQVTYIHRSAVSLGEMVNDLLDLAKIESGRLEVQAVPFAAADLLAALRGMFRPLVAGSAVPLLIDEAHGLTTLNTDERKLTQILRNLLSNALKFTEAGHVRMTSAGGPNGTAVFTVEDTGIGIASEHFERIFDDFTQIDSGVQRRVKGTGLGLPLARKLTHLLGGEITVSSTPGVGTKFVVVLPAGLSTTMAAPPVVDPAGEFI